MIWIVAGGRDFDDAGLLNDVLSRMVKPNDVILQGGARGADALAKSWALDNGIDSIEVAAQWRVSDGMGGTVLDRGAGHKRNAEMASMGAGGLIAFWDGVSRGTKSMIEIAKQKQLSVTVISYKGKAER